MTTWSLSRSHRPLLNPLLVCGTLEDALDENAGGMDLVGFEYTGFYQFFYFSYSDPSRCGHHGVKIPGSALIHQVAHAKTGDRL